MACMDEKLKLPYHGTLIKFTNVVKGWQARWFIIDPERGVLEYYLSQSDTHEKARGSISLVGAVISPSDEDSQTFTVSPTVGESYKLRAQDTKNRQMWINRLRVVAEMHTRAVAHHHPPISAREHRIRSDPSSSSLGVSGVGGGLDVLDAFTQVAEGLEEAQRLQSVLVQSVEQLPSTGPGITRIDSNALLIKATSQATLFCLDQCLSALRSRHFALKYSTETQRPSQSAASQTKSRNRTNNSSHHRSSSFIKSHKRSHSPKHLKTPAVTPQPTPELENSQDETSSHSALFEKCKVGTTSTQRPLHGSTPNLTNPSSNPVAVVAETSTPVEKEIPDDSSEVTDTEASLNSFGHEDDGPVEEGQKSVIMHIISQLRLGMDLTRVTLPTFILEKRSLLEMFADFLGHPEFFLRIGTRECAKDRMLEVVRWYLTSIHVGRRGSTAKKPYNPIIGEVFNCSWRVPVASVHDKVVDGKKSLPEFKYYKIRFTAEQVSHHPPVSAFYFECPEMEMCINAHIWTKSKFMGMSVGVNLIGNITLYLGRHSEIYQLGMPSAYARSVLMDPWVELGGRVNIACPQSGFTAPIIFQTKPFYGGKLHKVTCEVKTGAGNVVGRVQGEWDSNLEFSYEGDDRIEAVTVNNLPAALPKRVRPIERQNPNESRCLWLDVTRALSRGCLETATNHKKALEDIQRAEEQQRLAAGVPFPTKNFSFVNDTWVYRELPAYAKKLSSTSS